MTKAYFGFGYDPTESENHFYLEIPKETSEEVKIYERFHWDEHEQKITRSDILKLRLSRHKWSKLSNDVAAEFNARLKAEKKPTGRFLVGGTPIEKLFGKELMVLLWGIENNDPSGIPIAIRNWKGLQPEERWWLYTMTNASTGKINDRRGWRMALRYALCENPIDESNQVSLFDDLLGGK
ncbi:DUF3780 domain-containing protein [Acetobacterium malicum]|uniref:DUF3780 domain-containing protein n=1 Tax=Acetobacterium malicum TaxID=52692 RepID=UPI003592FAA1